jgi:hypothetical protein
MIVNLLVAFFHHLVKEGTNTKKAITKS